MAVTVEWTNQECILCEVQVASSLTISSLAHHLIYKQHLIAWEIGYFSEKKATLFHYPSKLETQTCGVLQKLCGYPERQVLHSKDRIQSRATSEGEAKLRFSEQTQWMPGLIAAERLQTLFLAQSFLLVVYEDRALQQTCCNTLASNLFTHPSCF